MLSHYRQTRVLLQITNNTTNPQINDDPTKASDRLKFDIFCTKRNFVELLKVVAVVVLSCPMLEFAAATALDNHTHQLKVKEF